MNAPAENNVVRFPLLAKASMEPEGRNEHYWRLYGLLFILLTAALAAVAVGAVVGGMR